MILDENNPGIKEEYKTLAEQSASFYTNEKLDELRNIKILDSLRNEDNPDDIIVAFYKEGIWVSWTMWLKSLST
ncbi:hypothetical protein [Methanobrevibacter sp.]|uniref:hypothetical protein n=1 Tax=Methanobrevibacter sp. TaxID=66852 RepID=UPI0026E02009|nr:hypothetical protein [Methanobrevibacter sp.]